VTRVDVDNRCPRRAPSSENAWRLTDGRITDVKINFDDSVDENAVREITPR